ncbi:hypothetical protein A3A66_01625 [Microgenomates group bacterium RIFCSPLOWO2_01_FULL_46_13]|nr:MAG: hypothetical protein A2783_00775 [Microgenomates group bacterium RIFCSPHIGHO2_01_FULL_45_11]OGV94695.1 MAG: hypothetical protein A3A66_01625 [Microgenomates group bacterium RIFCSPLOWO2_01_FULL_46_13]
MIEQFTPSPLETEIDALREKIRKTAQAYHGLDKDTGLWLMDSIGGMAWLITGGVVGREPLASRLSCLIEECSVLDEQRMNADLWAEFVTLEIERQL